VTRDIEDLIRAAQEVQADRALPADRIRAALPQRTAAVRRRQRYGMLGATVAAAAVVAAVTVPIVVLRGGEAQPAAPVAAGTVPASAEPSATKTETALPAEFPLGFRATWAPPGFTERVRQTGVAAPGDPFGPTLMRTWSQHVGTGDPGSSGGPYIELYVRTQVSGEGRLAPNGGKKVDVNGAPGYYHGSVDGEGKSYLDWGINEHTVLSLGAHRLDMSKADLLRMARSVRPDPGVTTLPVTLRWLPDGWTTGFAVVSGDTKAAWYTRLGAEKVGPLTGRDKEDKTIPPGSTTTVGQLSIEVASSTDAPDGGAKLTVGGHPARNPVRTESFAKAMIYLVVDLGHGRLMTLIGEGGGITLDDLTKIAEQAEISPSAPDWIG
jgi:hypothetical protein